MRGRNGVDDQVELLGRRLHGVCVRVDKEVPGAHPLGVGLFAVRGRQHRHLGAQGGGQFDRHMAQAAQADYRHLRARPHAPGLQRGPGGHARAQQRRRRIQRQAVGYVQHEGLVDGDSVRIAALGDRLADACALRIARAVGLGHARLAILLQPLAAGRTGPAAVDHAADADAVAFLEARDVRADRRHHPGDLMTRYDGIARPAQIVLHHMQVRVADAAVFDLDRHVVRPRIAALEAIGAQRLVGGVLQLRVLELGDQRLGRRRVPHLGPRDEVGEDIAPPGPAARLCRHRVQLARGHARRLVLAAGHQPGVGEVRRRLVDLRPGRLFVVDRIDDGRPILPRQIIELFGGEGRVAHLQRVAQPHAVLLLRQQLQKALEVLRIEFLGPHELPVDRPQLVAQHRQPLRQEPLETLGAVGQNLSIRAVTAGLDRKDEAVRRLVAPLRPVVGLEGRIIGAVDLDRGQRPAGELQLPLLHHLTPSTEEAFRQQRCSKDNHRTAREAADGAGRLGACAQYSFRTEADDQIDDGATENVDRAQGHDLCRNRPSGAGVCKLGQQGEKQQDDLGIQAADAKALEAPTRPETDGRLVSGARNGGVHQHAEAEPQQIARPGDGQHRHGDGDARHQSRDAGCDDQGGRQMAQQQAGDCGQDAMAHPGRDGVGPVRAGRDHEQEGHRPESGEAPGRIGQGADGATVEEALLLGDDLAEGQFDNATPRADVLQARAKAFQEALLGEALPDHHQALVGQGVLHVSLDLECPPSWAGSPVGRERRDPGLLGLAGCGEDRDGSDGLCARFSDGAGQRSGRTLHFRGQKIEAGGRVPPDGGRLRLSVEGRGRGPLRLSAVPGGQAGAHPGRAEREDRYPHGRDQADAGIAVGA
uniref:EAL domain-containing protein n=1 Tax=Parastrongyloides trichosuri TaxID=131310 RepID=A0A0N4ZIQ7_PARTI